MNNVSRLQLASDTVSAPATITPAELKSLLGWLGLPKTWFAHQLGVKDRQVARWEDGDAAISEAAAAELLKLWNEAAEQLAVIVRVAADNATPDGVIHLCTYRVDKDYDSSGGYPSSYHRALMCRAMDHLLMRTSCRVQLHYYEGNP